MKFAIQILINRGLFNCSEFWPLFRCFFRTFACHFLLFVMFFFSRFIYFFSFSLFYLFICCMVLDPYGPLKSVFFPVFRAVFQVKLTLFPFFVFARNQENHALFPFLRVVSVFARNSRVVSVLCFCALFPFLHAWYRAWFSRVMYEVKSLGKMSCFLSAAPVEFGHCLLRNFS